MRERNDKRRVGYSERDPHSADARFDKGLSTGMLSPFFAWTQKVRPKKIRNNARAAPLFERAGRELHSRNGLSCDAARDAIMW